MGLIVILSYLKTPQLVDGWLMHIVMVGCFFIPDTMLFLSPMTPNRINDDAYDILKFDHFEPDLGVFTEIQGQDTLGTSPLSCILSATTLSSTSHRIMERFGSEVT